jgi:hypothetical protein
MLQSLASEASDHCPFLLSLSEGSARKQRFHFESFWTKLPMFMDTVQSSWNEHVHLSCPVQRISIKLKRLARPLQSMGQKQIGHLKSQLDMAREILHKLEIAQDTRPLTDKEEWLRREAKR